MTTCKRNNSNNDNDDNDNNDNSNDNHSIRRTKLNTT